MPAGRKPCLCQKTNWAPKRHSCQFSQLLRVSIFGTELSIKVGAHPGAHHWDRHSLWFTCMGIPVSPQPKLPVPVSSQTLCFKALSCPLHLITNASEGARAPLVMVSGKGVCNRPLGWAGSTLLPSHGLENTWALE